MATPNSAGSSSSNYSSPYCEHACEDEMSPNVTAPRNDSPAANGLNPPQRSYAFTPEQIKFLYRGAPPGIPIRTKPQGAAFEELDAEYNMKEHPILDEDKMVGKGGVEARAGESEKSRKDAATILRQHMKDRMPYVHLAHKRYQAALALTNDLEFDLPNILLSKMSPQFKTVIDPSEPANKMGFFNPTLLGAPVVPQNEGQSRKDSGVGLDNNTKIDNNNNVNDGGESFNVPAHMVHSIDPDTGKGLREWLLRVGTENGTSKKKPCKSISFHDWTPDIKTGNFDNILVRHYDARKLGHRIDAYELDLPTPAEDPNTGKDIIINQRWIWFLISQPLVSIDPRKEYFVSGGSTSSNDNLSTSEASSNDQTFGPPPNFPDPIPTSWMVFAAPLSNITVYREVSDTSSDQHGDESEHPPAKRNNPFSKGKIIHKRKNYDFSHQGTPLFEFSMATAEILPLDPRQLDRFKQGSFLSVEDMPPFSGTPRQANPNDVANSFGGTVSADRWQWRSNDEFERAAQIWIRVLNERRMTRSKKEQREDEIECRLRETEFPSPYSGSWWRLFYNEIYKDEASWRRIKKAMAAGSCRVVVRWTEWEDEEVKSSGPKRTGLGIGVAKGHGMMRERSSAFGSMGMALMGPMIGGGDSGTYGGRMPAKGHGQGLARSRSSLSLADGTSSPYPAVSMLGRGRGNGYKL